MYAFAAAGSYAPKLFIKYQVDVLPNGASLGRVAWPSCCGLHCCVRALSFVRCCCDEYLRTFETSLVPQMFAGIAVPFVCPVFVQGSIAPHLPNAH